MKSVLLIALAVFLCVGSMIAQNHSLQFDGGQRAVLTDFELDGDFTVGAWFLADPGDNGGFDDRIIGLGAANRIEFGVADGADCPDGRVWIFDQAAGLQECYDAGNLRDGEWHNLTVVKEGITRTIYVDGTAVGTFDGPDDTIYSNRFVVGSWAGGASPATFFTGEIDEVRLWERALTAAELNETLSCELDGDEDDLRIYYTFNQGTPGGDNQAITTVMDKTGNGNDASLTAFALNGNSTNFVLSGSGVDELCNPNAVVNALTERFNVWPTLTSDVVRIENANQLRGTVHVLNADGKQLFTQPLSDFTEVQLGELSDGMYLLQVRSEGQTGLYRVVKQ